MEITWRFDSPDAIQDVAVSSQSCGGQIPTPPGLIRVKEYGSYIYTIKDSNMTEDPAVKAAT